MQFVFHALKFSAAHVALVRSDMIETFADKSYKRHSREEDKLSLHTSSPHRFVSMGIVLLCIVINSRSACNSSRSACNSSFSIKRIPSGYQSVAIYHVLPCLAPSALPKCRQSSCSPSRMTLLLSLLLERWLAYSVQKH